MRPRRNAAGASAWLEMAGAPMKTARWCLLGLALPLAAGELAGQSPTLALSGNPQALIVGSAIAGFAPDPVEDHGTTYSLATAETAVIEAELDGPLPPGVTLRVRLTPPAGAVGAGVVTLTTSPQVVVTSIPPGSYADLLIEYELIATVAGGVVLLNTRQVTFTISPL